LVVEVVGPNGEPLVGAQVEGLVAVNPGPAESTCCTQKRFALEGTSESGRATLTGVADTMREFEFRATYRDWPSRSLKTSQVTFVPVIRIALGPAREVRGRVEWGPDCTPSNDVTLRVFPSATRAPVSPDGTFFLSDVSPWSLLYVEACGRSGQVQLELGDDQPVTIELLQPSPVGAGATRVQ
jgi:hypothetical protein